MLASAIAARSARSKRRRGRRGRREAWRATTAGKQKRNGQSQRYRERLKTRKPSEKEAAPPPARVITKNFLGRLSHAHPDDRRLAFAESAIDALSYAALFPDAEDRTRYASLGGKPSSRKMGLVQATIARLRPGAQIITAFDADDAGRPLVELKSEAVASVNCRTGGNDLVFKAHLPANDGEDWNQVLQNAARDQTGLAKQAFGNVKGIRPG